MVKSIKIGYNEKENIIMKEFKYTITDPEGIHARPAGELVKAAKQFTSTIKLAKDFRYHGTGGKERTGSNPDL